MKYFNKINICNVSFIYAAIVRQPSIWEENTIRQDFPNSPHKQTQSIVLRFNKYNNPNTVVEEVYDDCECFDTPSYDKLPEARPLIFGLMSLVQGERLGRVLIVKLPPNGKVDPHRDMGAPADYYDRYHIVIKSSEGNLFRTEDEIVWMQEGEVWWFDNTKEHEVVNNSKEDRIHLIVDIRSRGSKA